MRKRQIAPNPPSFPPAGETWLDMNSAALVEVTSEENGYPIESALLGGETQGLACGGVGHANYPTHFRQATISQAYLAGFQGY
jgi:hypothetical protein